MSRLVQRSVSTSLSKHARISCSLRGPSSSDPLAALPEAMAYVVAANDQVLSVLSAAAHQRMDVQVRHAKPLATLGPDPGIKPGCPSDRQI